MNRRPGRVARWAASLLPPLVDLLSAALANAAAVWWSWRTPNPKCRKGDR